MHCIPAPFLATVANLCVLLPAANIIWRGIKFGGLAVYITKIRQNFLLAYIRNPPIFLQYIAILGSTAKFNARQYFRLYGTSKSLDNKLAKWSPSNPDTLGIQCWWPDYRGVLFSGVTDRTWVWLIAKIDDVMQPVTSQVRHVEAIKGEVSSSGALAAL